MRLTRCNSVAILVFAGLLLGASAPLYAYPQFQLSTYSATCSACHFSPLGGGLINGFGRDEAGDTISRDGGNGQLLHGLWQPPEWFQIGGDLRGAGIYKKTWDEPQLLGFPMQADLYTRFAVKSVSFNLTAGMRGVAREPRRPVVERLWSREHYLMWQPTGSDYYARVGRFFAPFGLRLPDHTAYVRRYLGQNSLEEPYNLSAGRIDSKWEVHGSLFLPSPLFPYGRRARGVSLYYERRIREESAAFGVQSRFDVATEDSRTWLGGVGKLWLDGKKILLLSELDLGLQRFRFDGADAQLQIAWYLGASWFVSKGILVGSAIEHYDQDLTLGGSSRDSFNVTVQYFPYAHVEVMLLGKLESQGFDSLDPQTMLMLHYYL